MKKRILKVVFLSFLVLTVMPTAKASIYESIFNDIEAGHSNQSETPSPIIYDDASIDPVLINPSTQILPHTLKNKNQNVLTNYNQDIAPLTFHSIIKDLKDLGAIPSVWTQSILTRFFSLIHNMPNLGHYLSQNETTLFFHALRSPNPLHLLDAFAIAQRSQDSNLHEIAVSIYSERAYLFQLNKASTEELKKILFFLKTLKESNTQQETEKFVSLANAYLFFAQKLESAVQRIETNSIIMASPHHFSLPILLEFQPSAINPRTSPILSHVFMLVTDDYKESLVRTPDGGYVASVSLNSAKIYASVLRQIHNALLIKTKRLLDQKGSDKFSISRSELTQIYTGRGSLSDSPNETQIQFVLKAAHTAEYPTQLTCQSLFL